MNKIESRPQSIPNHFLKLKATMYDKAIAGIDIGSSNDIQHFPEIIVWMRQKRKHPLITGDFNVHTHHNPKEITPTRNQEACLRLSDIWCCLCPQATPWTSPLISATWVAHSSRWRLTQLLLTGSCVRHIFPYIFHFLLQKVYIWTLAGAPLKSTCVQPQSTGKRSL